MKPNTGLIVALLSYNWKGLIGSAVTVYSGAYVLIQQTIPILPPKVAAGLAGLAAVGNGIGFFVQTYKPGATMQLQFSPVQGEALSVADMPAPSVMPTAPVTAPTPAPAPAPFFAGTLTEEQLAAAALEFMKRKSADPKGGTL